MSDNYKLTLSDKILFFFIKLLAFICYIIAGVILLVFCALGALLAIIIGLVVYLYKIPFITRYMENIINGKSNNEYF